MAYKPKSMTQEEWDALPPAPLPRPMTDEEKAEFKREGREMMAAFVGNLNASALESEAWHDANDISELK